MEIKKVIKSKGILLLSIGLLVIIGLLYLNYTTEGSTVFELSLCDITNTITFFIFMYGMLFITIWSSIIGVYLGTFDMRNKTILNLVVLRGRYVPYVTKIISAFTLNLGFILLMSILAGVTGIVKNGWCQINIGIVGVQIIVMTIVGSCISLLAFVFSVMIKNSTVSNIIVIVLLYVPAMIGEKVSEYLKYINPMTYFEARISAIFKNIEDLKYIHLKVGTFQEWYLLCFYVLLCIGILIMLLRRRNYK